MSNNPNPHNNPDQTAMPMGLNFKDYLNNENQPIGQSSDGPIIDEALESNNDFVRIMQKRSKDLKTLTSSWNKGRKGEVIDIISSMNDIGIVNSFVLYAIIKTEPKRIDLTCNEANVLLGPILNLVNSKNDQHFLNGILSAWNLVRIFQEVIINTKASVGYGGGIDLNKEDKIRKYDIFLGYIKQIRKSNNFTYWLGKSSKVEGVDLNKFATEVDYLLRKCNF